jgi:radical SAM superfamily enzyme YgiQ (UPF0313 family)
MKVTLLNPPGLKPRWGLQMHTPNLPIGLAYVAAALRGAGHEVLVLDAVGEAPDRITPAPFRADDMVQGLSAQELAQRVPRDSDLVGVTCMFSSQWLIARELLWELRRHLPAVRLVVGGEHMSALPEHVLSTSPADVVVLGEGEEIAVELAAALASGRDLAEVDGVAFRSADGEVRRSAPRKRLTQVDDILPPAWDLFQVERYIERQQMHGVNRGRAMPILGTRGCPYQCTFCSSPQMWTQRWIARDPVRLVDEIEGYQRRYGATDFHFQDLTAIIRKDWIIAFAREVLRRGLSITYQLPSGTRSEAIDREVASWLFRSGCRNMAYAPESGSDELRRVVKKQVKLDRMLESIQEALEEGLSLSCFFVIGFPDETEATLHETLDLVRRLARLGLHDIGVAKFVPYPGSSLFARALREGTIRLDDEYFLSVDAYAQGEHTTSFCPAISPRRLHAWQLRLLTEFYARSVLLHPLRTTRAVVKVLSTGEEETRFAKMIRDVVRTRLRWARHLRRPAAMGDSARGSA